MTEQRSGLLFRELLAFLASAGIATGVLGLVGHASIWSRYKRLGVPAREFSIDTSEYVIVGFNEALPFLFALVFAALFTAKFFLREAKVTFTDETHQQHLLSYCAVGGIMMLANALVGLNTTPIVVAGYDLRVSVYQIVIVLSTAFFATLVIVAMTGTWGGWLRPVLGRTFTGHIVLALIATMGLVGGALITGDNRAGDELWNLEAHEEVTLTFENGTQKTYFFVAHANAAYYVRDRADFGGRETGILIIPESTVTEAYIVTRPRDAR